MTLRVKDFTMRAVHLLVAAAAALVLVATPLARASSDPMFGQQYGPQQVNAPSAWQRSTGSGVVIAVVDTGVDLHHPDLVSKLVPGHDFVDDDATPDDGNGHGTHVAGIAAAATGNGVGIAGMAPAARIMPVRVLGNDGKGYSDDVVTGVRWAVDHGAKVVNLSLAGEVSLLDTLLGNTLEDAASYAFSKGALVVAAAGNSVAGGSTQPSGYSSNVQAVVVTATDAQRRHPDYANRADTAWSMAAPGDAIVSTYKGGGYKVISGTSMATPHVAGAAALLFAEGLTNRQVVDRLLGTAHSLGSRADDGAGLLDAAAAVGAAAPAATAAPAPPAPRGSARTAGNAPAAPAPAATAAPAPAAAGTSGPAPAASPGQPAPAPTNPAPATTGGPLGVLQPDGESAKGPSGASDDGRAVAIVVAVAACAVAGGALAASRRRSA